MAIQTITELHERGVNIKSLTEPDIDTTTPMGRALFGIVAVFAQLRIDTIRDNTRGGLALPRLPARSPVTTRRTQRWCVRAASAEATISEKRALASADVVTAMTRIMTTLGWGAADQSRSSSGLSWGRSRITLPRGQEMLVPGRIRSSSCSA